MTTTLRAAAAAFLALTLGGAAWTAVTALPAVPSVSPAEGRPALGQALEAARPEEARGDDGGRAAWTLGARLFDRAKTREAGSWVLGAAALPALGHVSLPSAAALLPAASAVGYGVANALSVAFPVPQIHHAFSQGDADKFPVVRAAIGAVGTFLLGAVNATVLGKPMWGVHAHLHLAGHAGAFLHRPLAPEP